MYKHSLTILLFACSIIVLRANAQISDSTEYVMRYYGLDKSHIPKKSRMNTTDWEEAKTYLISQLRADNYLLCSIDSVQVKADTMKVFCYQGQKVSLLKIEEITGDNADPILLSHWGKIHHSDELNSQIQRTLSYYENHGFPFASVSIDDSRLINDTLMLSLRLDKANKITYDSLLVSPNELIKPSFLAKLLKMDYGRQYQEEHIAAIPDLIQRLSFVQLQEVKTTFQLKKAKVELVLTPMKVNRFDGILGLVPSPSGGVAFTGQLDLSIKNLFHTAKALDINWLKPNVGSQQLHASYLHPILLGSPLDFYFSIDQLRQDSTYSNRSITLGLDINPTRYFSARFKYENKLGNALQDMSQTASFGIDYYGIEAEWSHLDNRYYPKNGWKMKGMSSIGLKKVQDETNPVPNSTQFTVGLVAELYKKIGRRSVLFAKSNNALLLNKYLYLNDLYRIGGLQTIRGFNELEFFASLYAVINLEWRYYFDAKSYLVAFIDQGFLKYQTIDEKYTDQPVGFGAGMNFSTDSGLFSLLFGLGKRNGESFSFDSGKLHFGYTAFF